MADLLDRTATQVRLPGEIAHERAERRFVPDHGYVYRTRCGMSLKAERGAMLTTMPVGCRTCQDVARGLKVLSSVLHSATQDHTGATQGGRP